MSSSLSGSRCTPWGGEALFRGVERPERLASSEVEFNGVDFWLLSIPLRLTYRAAALAERTGNGAVRRLSDMEFSLYTLECPGLAFGESVGVWIWRCFDGGTPS